MNVEERLEALAAQMERIEKATILSAKEILVTNEAAMYTGMSEYSIRDKARKGEITFYKTAHTLYFKKADLDAYMLQEKHASMAEIDQQANLYLLTHKR